jgi:hypothetical protein
MQRTLHHLRRLIFSFAARRHARHAPAARPALEVLEGRDMPATLGLVSMIGPSVPHLTQQNLQVAPVVRPAINFPSPAMLAGTVVHLGEPGTPSNAFGVLTIIDTTLQADGSYTFHGAYQTSLWDMQDSHGQPVVVAVTGTLFAPQYTTVFNATCTIFFDAVASQVSWSHNGTVQQVDEHVHFSGTVTMSPGHATVLGQLYDCPEDPVTHMAIVPTCGSPPTAGTFM